jgi:hypothetical protein
MASGLGMVVGADEQPGFSVMEISP